MADALKGVIIVILLAFVFGVYPAFRQSEVVEKNTKLAANAAMVEFVDTVRAKGYVDVGDYERFLHTLDASYAVFDVQMEYYKKNLEPLYTNPDDYSTFQNSFSVRYDGYFNKDILGVLYPGSTLRLLQMPPAEGSPCMLVICSMSGWNLQGRHWLRGCGRCYSIVRGFRSI